MGSAMSLPGASWPILTLVVPTVSSVKTVVSYKSELGFYGLLAADRAMDRVKAEGRGVTSTIVDETRVLHFVFHVSIEYVVYFLAEV